MAGGDQRQDRLPLGSKSWVLAAAEVERRFNAAADGETITYAEGQLQHGETSRYVMRLYEAGLADLRQPRVPGGFEYIVRKRPGAASANAPSPEESDDAAETILRALKRAANLGQRCPSDRDLAREAGLPTRDRAAWRIRKLVDAGLIKSSVEPGPDGPWRTVTIVETRKQTLLPPALRAVRRSIRQAASDDGPEEPRRGRRWQ